MSAADQGVAEIVLAGILPGQRAIMGTRSPPTGKGAAGKRVRRARPTRLARLAWDVTACWRWLLYALT